MKRLLPLEDRLEHHLERWESWLVTRRGRWLFWASVAGGLGIMLSAWPAVIAETLRGG